MANIPTAPKTTKERLKEIGKQLQEIRPKLEDLRDNLDSFDDTNNVDFKYIRDAVDCLEDSILNIDAVVKINR